jgi:N-acetylmuramoyl-L-alanine amidase
MCCHKNDSGNWYFDDITVENAIALAKELMAKYNIPIDNVIRHYDVTGKQCPAPFVLNPQEWINFKKRLVDMTIDEAKQIIKEKTGFSDETIQYLWSYRFGDELLIRLAKSYSK